jgi:raffinose/stachyose/melibiose transport system permease protein
VRTTRSDRALRHVALIPFLLVAILPIYILLISAFKTTPDILATPLTIPFDRLTLDNVISAFNNPQLDIGAAFLRTVAITAATVAISTIAAGMVAYILSRSSRRVSIVIYVVLISGILIPSQVLLIPVIRILQLIGLQGSFVGLVLYMAALQLPYAVFLYMGFIATIPRELDEAAFVDGSGVFGTYWRIIFPVLKPATASIAIFNGLGAFNNFIDPLIILGPTGGRTITTGVFASVGQYNTDYGAVFGNLLVAILPVMIAYFIMQRQFIDGLTEGSVKG